MTVLAILGDKGRSVETIKPSKTISDAVDVLARKRIGALVVVDENRKIVGIVSERDIIRSISADGAGVLDAPVSTIMTRSVVTCEETETIDCVMSRMTRGRFRHLPVEDGGRLAGIVSIGDVVKARIEQVEREAEDMRAYISNA
jgi:CBS domain-containing protein